MKTKTKKAKLTKCWAIAVMREEGSLEIDMVFHTRSAAESYKEKCEERYRVIEVEVREI